MSKLKISIMDIHRAPSKSPYRKMQTSPEFTLKNEGGGHADSEYFDDSLGAHLISSEKTTEDSPW